MQGRVRGAGAATILAALMLAGCEQPAQDTLEISPEVSEVLDSLQEAPAVEEDMVYAGADMNGQAVTLPVGGLLRVELESIPTAGYLWNIKDKPDFLDLEAEHSRPTDPQTQDDPLFTGGNHYLASDFRATAVGTGTLTLIEGRPWELDAGQPPEDTFQLSVTVTE
jgi:inhibitor of cysteine peptidase